MKLRNKKTGEIVEICAVCPEPFEARDFNCKTLAELNEEWTDYEESKEYWYIDTTEGTVVEHTQEMFELTDEERKQIGNYFETKEEAEQAVEKLKAWKRLQDAGVTFHAKVIDYKWYLMPKINDKSVNFKEAHEIYKDIDLVFGVKDNEGNQ